MSFWQNIISYINKYFSISYISVVDIIEILIIAVVFYYIMMFFKQTRAWALFKGIVVILVMVLLAAIFNFNTILWIASRTISVGIIAIIVIFQPELRRALESLGDRKFFRTMFFADRNRKKLFTDETMEEILSAVNDLAKEKTGALICIESNISLSEYERTGINIDATVSSELLKNIFEYKTPLHDGAVIIRDNRIVAATCYLPMSTNRKIDKKYGTRHRAALGLSEITDSYTIVVSEETGKVSVAQGGILVSGLNAADLKNSMIQLQSSERAQKERKKEKEQKGGDKNAE